MRLPWNVQIEGNWQDCLRESSESWLFSWPSGSLGPKTGNSTTWKATSFYCCQICLIVINEHPTLITFVRLSILQLCWEYFKAVACNWIGPWLCDGISFLPYEFKTRHENTVKVVYISTPLYSSFLSHSNLKDSGHPPWSPDLKVFGCLAAYSSGLGWPEDC